MKITSKVARDLKETGFNPVRFPRVGQRVRLAYGFELQTKSGKHKDDFKAGITGEIVGIDSHVNAIGMAQVRVKFDDGRRIGLDTDQLEKA